MRMKLLLAALPCALGLAACSGEADEGVTANENSYGESDAAAAQAGEPAGDEGPGDQAAPQIARADYLASDYHGVWDHVDGTCDPLSEMRLEITADQLQFYESTGDITGVERESNGDRLVTVAMSGEGETWDATFRLEMDSTAQFLVVTGIEEEFEGVRRKRCS